MLKRVQNAASELGYRRILTAGLLAASRRIAHIGGPHRTSTAQNRYAGFLDAHVSAGVDPDPSLIFETDYSEQGGYDAMKSLLELPWWASSVHPVTPGSQPSYRLGRTAAELLVLRLTDPTREYAEVTVGHGE
jgi:DNA-binding LacI/PurR family transcriptional regulator